jgi:hypothetical protein
MSFKLSEGITSIPDIVLAPSIEARFAPVVPLALQRLLTEHVSEDTTNLMGNYHLLLAHLILEDPNRWGDYYSENPGCFTIMDNSLIELGISLDPAKIVAAAEVVGADCVVLPDTLLEMEKTVESSTEAARKIGFLPAHCQFLAVVQGRNIEEIDVCIKRFLQEIPQLGYISIPRITTSVMGSRMPAIFHVARVMADYGIRLPIHLLGFSDNIYDDFLCTHHPDVMGIDSAVPVWAGLKGVEFPIDPRGFGQLGKRPTDFMDRIYLTPSELGPIKRNLDLCRKWLRDEAMAKLMPIVAPVWIGVDNVIVNPDETVQVTIEYDKNGRRITHFREVPIELGEEITGQVAIDHDKVKARIKELEANE